MDLHLDSYHHNYPEIVWEVQINTQPGAPSYRYAEWKVLTIEGLGRFHDLCVDSELTQYALRFLPQCFEPNLNLPRFSVLQTTS